MIKVFISHKKEDSFVASRIAHELDVLNIPYYLDEKIIRRLFFCRAVRILNE